MLEFIFHSLRYLPVAIPFVLLFFIGNLAHFSANNKDHNALFPLALLAFVYVFMPLAVFFAV